jgi:hypothetical protein
MIGSGFAQIPKTTPADVGVSARAAGWIDHLTRIDEATTPGAFGSVGSVIGLVELGALLAARLARQSTNGVSSVGG